MGSTGIEDYNTAYETEDIIVDDIEVDTSLDEVIERLLDLYPYGDTAQSNWAHNELARVREPLTMAAADLDREELEAAIHQVGELVEAACREDNVHVPDVFSDDTILKLADLMENPQAEELVELLKSIEAEQQASEQLQQAAQRHRESVASSRSKLEAIAQYVRADTVAIEPDAQDAERDRSESSRVAFASGKRPSRGIGQEQGQDLSIGKAILPPGA